MMKKIFVSATVETTVEAIGALSRAVAGYRGRKNLLWLSAGFPLYVALTFTF